MRNDVTVKIYAITNDVLLLIVLSVNALANILPIAGITTGEVSDTYRNLFIPAGFTFSIWGIIYLLLILFAGYQTYLAFHKTHPDRESILRLGPWFALSCIANSLWILAWHHQVIWLSLILMLIILSSLYLSYRKLGIGQVVVSQVLRTLIHIPISVYLGWISVATIANFSAFFIGSGWDGSPLPQTFYTVLMIAAALVLGLLYLYRNHDVWYAFVISWALFGILMRQITFYEASYVLIIVAAAISIVLLLTYAVYLLVIGKVYR